MATNEVTIATGDDAITRQLARALLVCEIAAQVLACYLVVEMAAHGQVGYLLRWHLERWKRKLRDADTRRRTYHLAYNQMLFEANTILREADHGRA